MFRLSFEILCIFILQKYKLKTQDEGVKYILPLIIQNVSYMYYAVRIVEFLFKKIDKCFYS